MILPLGKKLLFTGLIIVLLGVGCVQAPTEPVTPTPGLTQYYSLCVTIDPLGAGSVSPAEGYFTSGSEVTLEATPASGYAFDRWGGDVSDRSDNVSFTMDSDKHIIAYFRSLDPSPVPKVSIEEAKSILDTGDNVVMVDIRSKVQFERSHIDGAVSIPIDGLADRYNEIDPEAQVLVYASCA